MFAQMTSSLDFQATALKVRAERQRVIASNIANADTPGYKARDLNFQEAMASAMQNSSAPSLTAVKSNDRHIPTTQLSGELGNAQRLLYASQAQPSMDGNSVDMDQERSKFVDNAVRYEATLRFVTDQSKSILSAIQGQ